MSEIRERRYSFSVCGFAFALSGLLTLLAQIFPSHFFFSYIFFSNPILLPVAFGDVFTEAFGIDLFLPVILLTVLAWLISGGILNYLSPLEGSQNVHLRRGKTGVAMVVGVLPIFALVWIQLFWRLIPGYYGDISWASIWMLTFYITIAFGYLATAVFDYFFKDKFVK